MLNLLSALFISFSAILGILSAIFTDLSAIMDSLSAIFVVLSAIFVVLSAIPYYSPLNRNPDHYFSQGFPLIHDVTTCIQ